MDAIDTTIITAVILTLLQQDKGAALPEDLLTSFKSLAFEWKDRAVDLEDLMQATPSLATQYQENLKWLWSQSGERSKGLQDIIEPPESGRYPIDLNEIANIAIDIRNKIISDEEVMPKILSDANPIQAAQSSFSNSKKPKDSGDSKDLDSDCSHD